MSCVPFSSSQLDRIARESFVAEIDFQPELGSTSDHALARLQDESLRLPLLILAERQTGGRGRGANRWWSADGALTFSLVLDPDQLGVTPGQLPQASLLTALAVAEAVGELWPQAPLALKWPNDVYLGGRKLCGILIEMPRPRRLVVGIGINVNNSLAAAPAEIASTAATLRDACGAETDRAGLLLRILRQYERHLRLLAEGDYGWWLHWHELCLLRGQRVELQAGTQRLVGLCQGVNPQGALLLRTPQGDQEIFAGTIVRVMPDATSPLGQE